MLSCVICKKETETTRHKLAVFEPDDIGTPGKKPKMHELDFCKKCWKLIEASVGPLSMGYRHE